MSKSGSVLKEVPGSDKLSEVFAMGVQQQQQPQGLVGASRNSGHVALALRKLRDMVHVHVEGQDQPP